MRGSFALYELRNRELEFSQELKSKNEILLKLLSAGMEYSHNSRAQPNYYLLNNLRRN